MHRTLEFRPLRGAGRLQGQPGGIERPGPGRGEADHGAVRRGLYRRGDHRGPRRGLRALGQAQEHAGIRAQAAEGGRCGGGVRGADHDHRLPVRHHQAGDVPHLLRPAADRPGRGLAEPVHRGDGAAVRAGAGGGVGPAGVQPAHRRQDGGDGQHHLHVEGDAPAHVLLLPAADRRHTPAPGLQRQHLRRHREHRGPAGAEHRHDGVLPGADAALQPVSDADRAGLGAGEPGDGPHHIEQARQPDPGAASGRGQAGLRHAGGHQHDRDHPRRRGRGGLLPPLGRLPGLGEHPEREIFPHERHDGHHSRLHRHRGQLHGAVLRRAVRNERQLHPGHDRGVPGLPEFVHGPGPHADRGGPDHTGAAHRHGAGGGRDAVPRRPLRARYPRRRRRGFRQAGGACGAEARHLRLFPAGQPRGAGLFAGHQARQQGGHRGRQRQRQVHDLQADLRPLPALGGRDTVRRQAHRRHSPGGVHRLGGRGGPGHHTLRGHHCQ